MSRARYQLKELRQRKYEIHQLRNKKQKQRLAKVSKNPHRSKGHSSRISKRIPHKDFGRIAIEVEQSERGCDERKHHRSREHVVLHIIGVSSDDNIHDIDEQQRARDYDGLAHFESVDARVNVDTVRAEDAQHYDVDIVPTIYIEEARMGLRRSIAVP